MNSLLPWRRQNGNTSLAPVSQLRWDWDRLFDRFLDDAWAPMATPASVQNLPLDYTETEDAIRIRAEVPGMDPKDLDISLVGDVLTLTGRKTEESESTEGSRTYSERRFGEFQRTLKLPCPVDHDKIEAEHRHGVVTITLHKAEAVRPKRIEIKSV